MSDPDTSVISVIRNRRWEQSHVTVHTPPMDSQLLFQLRELALEGLCSPKKGNKQYYLAKIAEYLGLDLAHYRDGEIDKGFDNR